MKPPYSLNVLDKHKWFTSYTRQGPHSYSTCWRPGAILKRGTVGTLLEYDESSFYQSNNNATMAIYKLPGYTHHVAVWFDNASGERIA